MSCPVIFSALLVLLSVTESRAFGTLLRRGGTFHRTFGTSTSFTIASMPHLYPVPRASTPVMQAQKGGAVSTSLAGRLWPAIQKFRIGPDKFKQIIANVVEITQWQDLVLLGVFAFGSLPVVRYSIERMKRAEKEEEEGDWETEEDEDFYEEIRDDITLRKRFRIAKLISQVSQVALSVYAVDVLSVVLTTLGFRFPQQWGLSSLYTKVSYTTFFLLCFLEFKKMALCRFFKVDSEDMGRYELLNRLLNGLSVTVVGLLLFDWIEVRMGMAAKSLFAFGSVGTLTFTLASKDLVESLLSGIFLTATNKMYVGDNVIFGDGTSGKVVRLGWMETVLRGGDNIMTRVPNRLLSNQKVSNVSRVTQSQVKQTLRFHYDDADEVPALLESIREEIKKSCPRLITDSSRPFRVFWTNINEDHLEVMVDTHFKIAPIGDAYWQNRQAVLMAIQRAVKKHNVELAQLYTFASTMGDVPEQRALPKGYIKMTGSPQPDPEGDQDDNSLSGHSEFSETS